MCFFFPSVLISVVSIFVFGGSASARRITYEYSIDDVTATWIEVNLVSPLLQSKWVPIFIGCLFCVGAYYPDFTVCIT